MAPRRGWPACLDPEFLAGVGLGSGRAGCYLLRRRTRCSAARSAALRAAGRRASSATGVCLECRRRLAAHGLALDQLAALPHPRGHAWMDPGDGACAVAGCPRPWVNAGRHACCRAHLDQQHGQDAGIAAFAARPDVAPLPSHGDRARWRRAAARSTAARDTLLRHPPAAAAAWPVGEGAGQRGGTGMAVGPSRRSPAPGIRSACSPSRPCTWPLEVLVSASSSAPGLGVKTSRLHMLAVGLLGSAPPASTGTGGLDAVPA